MTTPKFSAELLEKLSKLLAERAIERWLNDSAAAASAIPTAERTDAAKLTEPAGPAPAPARSLSTHQGSETKAGQP